MTKKQSTICSVVCLIIGVVGGIAGAAFSMGAEQQHIKDTLMRYATEIETMGVDNIEHKMSVQKEMDRHTEIMTAQTTYLLDSIRELTSTISDLRADVKVLKALMERVEKDLNASDT